jgi:SAM-dependent methyltransferase
MTTPAYLLDNARELDRLRLQSRVWETAGRDLLADIGDGTGRRVLDVGCGAMGWLRIFSAWVGPEGRVVGTDIAPTLLDAAATLVADEGLDNVEIVIDDLFASRLEPASFDVVHARFQIAPIGRAEEQLAAYRRWLKPGGILVLEDPESSSWRSDPSASATSTLIGLIRRAFIAGGGDFDAGRRVPELLRAVGVTRPRLRATVQALDPGHPYLRLPLQFATSLEGRLVPDLVDARDLADLRAAAEGELSREDAWGTTFTLIGGWGRLPA